MSGAIASVLVAACGNRMAADDAFGPLVADELVREPLAGMEVLDLGMSPAGLLDHLEGRRALIVVDAVLGWAPEEPPSLSGLASISDDEAVGGARVYEVNWLEAHHELLEATGRFSTHGLSLGAQLKLAAKLGRLPPEVWLLVAPAASFEVGTSPGPHILNAVPRAVRRIRTRARQLATSAVTP